MLRLPGLHLLRAFEAAARLNSFSRAAQEMSVTPSAVSHHVKDLEAFLDCRLFVRSPRAIELTTEGQAFYERLAPLLSALQDACETTSRARTVHGLSLHCAPSFAVKWLGPRLPEFLNAHPEISLRMSTGVELPSLPGSAGLDLAILYGAPLSQPGMRCESLGHERIAPMCSPKMASYITNLGAQIDSFPLIESPLSPVKWTDWCAWNKVVKTPSARLSMDRAALAIAGAVDHLGIALESTALAAKELANGDLVELRSPSAKPIERDLHFLCYRDGDLNAPMSTFRAWLLAAFPGS